MTCETYEALIALHIEGDLPADEADAVETHLALCARCRDFAADLGESQAALKDLADTEIDAAALAAVRRRVGSSLDRHERRVGLVWQTMAAAVVAIVVALFSSGARRPQPEPARITTAPVRAPLPPRQSVAITEAPPANLARVTSSVRETPRRHRVAAAQEARMKIERPLPSAPDKPSPPVLKVVTSDPDVVIYWATEPDGGQS
jgi:anti-sigma factor RsiW